MKLILRRIIMLSVLAGGLFAAAGCQSTAEDSSVPWSRPAEWEGRMPGMGGL
jgi:hypothetical protein